MVGPPHHPSPFDLGTSSNSFTWEKFHETDSVRKRFLEDFTTAYNALTFKPNVVPESETAAAVVASAAGDEKPPEPQREKG